MFYNDHDPPHLHARYGRAKAIVRLSDGRSLTFEARYRLVREDDGSDGRMTRGRHEYRGPDADE